MPLNNPGAYSDPRSPHFNPAMAAAQRNPNPMGGGPSLMGDAGSLGGEMSGLDPSMVGQTLALRSMGGRQKRLADKLRMAQEMSGAAMPQGRSAGGVFQAAHPLEFLGSLAQRGAGAFNAKKLEGQFAPLEAEEQATMRDYLMELLRAGGGGGGGQRGPMISDTPEMNLRDSHTYGGQLA